MSEPMTIQELAKELKRSETTLYGLDMKPCGERDMKTGGGRKAKLYDLKAARHALRLHDNARRKRWRRNHELFLATKVPLSDAEIAFLKADKRRAKQVGVNVKDLRNMQEHGWMVVPRFKRRLEWFMENTEMRLPSFQQFTKREKTALFIASRLTFPLKRVDRIRFDQFGTTGKGFDAWVSTMLSALKKLCAILKIDDSLKRFLYLDGK